MKLHSLIRYLALSVHHAEEGVNQAAAARFLEHFPDGKPKEESFDVYGSKRSLPRSSFQHHRTPGIRSARYTIESDALPGGMVTLMDNEGVPEEIASIEVPLKRSLFHKAASITVALEIVDRETSLGTDRVHEAYLSHPHPLPGEPE